MKPPLSAYHETKQHGSVLFPFDIYPCSIPQSFPSVPLHWHTSMEIIYIKKGRGQVQVGMEWYEALAGDIFVVLPEVLHAIRGAEQGNAIVEETAVMQESAVPEMVEMAEMLELLEKAEAPTRSEAFASLEAPARAEVLARSETSKSLETQARLEIPERSENESLPKSPSRRMEYENIIFALDFLGLSSGDLCAQQYLSLLANGKAGFPIRYRRGEDGYAELARCLAEAEKLCEFCPCGYELAVKASIFRLVFQLFQGHATCHEAGSICSFVRTKETNRLKQVLEMIQTEYMHDLKVSVIARRVGYSSSHFMRWFKELTGESFVHYLNERRLVVAADLLRKTDDYVVDIANQVGFTNLTNFNRQFKERFGLSPRAYRKS